MGLRRPLSVFSELVVHFRLHSPRDAVPKAVELFNLRSLAELPEKIANTKAMSSKPLFVSGWEVAGIRSARKFFAALTEVLPLPVRLCFEGTNISSDVRTLFASSAVAATLQIPPGTIWPKPSVFHVLATEQFIHELAALAGKHAGPEVCDHFHAYSDSHGPLMQWYDAFDLPLLIEESITEESLKGFCRKLGVQYARWHAPDKPPLVTG
jgi:hypothetical protein